MQTTWFAVALVFLILSVGCLVTAAVLCFFRKHVLTPRHPHNAHNAQSHPPVSFPCESQKTPLTCTHDRFRVVVVVVVAVRCNRRRKPAARARSLLWFTSRTVASKHGRRNSFPFARHGLRKAVLLLLLLSRSLDLYSERKPNTVTLGTKMKISFSRVARVFRGLGTYNKYSPEETPVEYLGGQLIRERERRFELCVDRTGKYPRRSEERGYFPDGAELDRDEASSVERALSGNISTRDFSAFAAVDACLRGRLICAAHLRVSARGD